MDLVNILLPLPSLRLKSRSSYKVEDIGNLAPFLRLGARSKGRMPLGTSLILQATNRETVSTRIASIVEVAAVPIQVPKPGVKF